MFVDELQVNVQFIKKMCDVIIGGILAGLKTDFVKGEHLEN